MSAYAPVGVQQPRPRFEYAAHLRVRAKRREAAGNVGRAQVLHRQPILRRARARARDQRSIRYADHQPTRPDEQLLAADALQLVPAGIRALDQRHILRVLVIRFADDACLTAARSELVRRAEAIEADHSVTASREMERGGTSRSAETGDRDAQLNSQGDDGSPICARRASAGLYR